MDKAAFMPTNNILLLLAKKTYARKHTKNRQVSMTIFYRSQQKLSAELESTKKRGGGIPNTERYDFCSS
jgi:hypothetical protein